MSKFDHTSPQELAPEVDILFMGRRRVTRKFVLGENNSIVDAIYSAYGDADPAELTSAFTGYANLRLVQQKVLPSAKAGLPSTLIQVFETIADSLAPETSDLIDFELNGLKRTTRQLIGSTAADISAFVVGTQSYGTSPVQYLASVKIEQTEAFTRVNAVYLQAGITDAEKKSDSDAGLLYVTFRSWHTKVIPTCLKGGSALNDDPTIAFQGGAAAQIYRDRIENVKGFRTYTVTVMMKIDGSALAVGSDQLVNSYDKYIAFTRPGVLSIDTSSANAKGWGFVGEPGAEKAPLALVQEYLSTVSTLDASFAPFMVTHWASAFLSYIQDGEAGTVSKSAHGYLGGASGAGTGNPTYSYSISSSPTIAAFLAQTNVVAASSNGPAFVTDEGVRWYKKTRISIPGTLASALA